MSAGREIDVGSMTLEQLQQVQQTLQQEVEVLTANLGTLKAATNKFKLSHEALTDVQNREDGEEMLVPLTSSLYVPGKLATGGKVLVDVGTGYYVQKSVEDALDFVDRKAGMLNENIENLYDVIQQKTESIETVAYVMQLRIQQNAEAQNNATATVQ